MISLYSVIESSFGMEAGGPITIHYPIFGVGAGGPFLTMVWKLDGSMYMMRS